MMRIIVITDTSFAASEAESIRILLSEGVDRVHLRKPQSAEADMRRLIEALPPELYPRLTLQDHLQLAKEYGIGGVHLNARNPEIPAGFGGVAFLGYIWQGATPGELVRRMREIQKFNR